MKDARALASLSDESCLSTISAIRYLVCLGSNARAEGMKLNCAAAVHFLHSRLDLYRTRLAPPAQ